MKIDAMIRWLKGVPEMAIVADSKARVVVDADNMDDGLDLNNEVSQELKSIYGVYFVANADYAITNENEILDYIESRNEEASGTCTESCN